MLKELETWAKMGCFSRKPRAHARNIIDTRWALKYKWDQPTTSASRSSKTRSGEGHPSEAGPKSVRTIRARLTVRGFKDCERGDIERYAGTSTRMSQKVLVSEAVQRNWDLVTADISKAFLQGVT